MTLAPEKGDCPCLPPVYPCLPCLPVPHPLALDVVTTVSEGQKKVTVPVYVPVYASVHPPFRASRPGILHRPINRFWDRFLAWRRSWFAWPRHRLFGFAGDFVFVVEYSKPIRNEDRARPLPAARLCHAVH